MSSKILINKTTVECCFTNLQLSFRGAERQAPHVLSLALMFSKVMQASAEDGSHPSSWGTEERLKAVINAFNSKDGVLAKWAVDEHSRGNDTHHTPADFHTFVVSQVEREQFHLRAFEEFTVASGRNAQELQATVQTALGCEPLWAGELHSEPHCQVSA